MKKTIILNLLLLSVMISSCQNNPSLEKLLFEKYHEEFIVHENSYNFMIGANEFVASPKRYPKLKTYGKYDSSWVSDDYPEQLRAYQAEQHIKTFFEKYHLKTYVNCHVASDINHNIDNRLAEFKDVLKDPKDETYIQNYIYLFEDINTENKNKLLAGVLDLIHYYNNFPGKRIYINVFFWDKEFVRDKNPDSLYFTLNVELVDKNGKDVNDDNIDNKKKYIKHTLDIKFKTPSNTIFTTDTLFSVIQPFNIKGNEKIYFE